MSADAKNPLKPLYFFLIVSAVMVIAIGFLDPLASLVFLTQGPAVFVLVRYFRKIQKVPILMIFILLAGFITGLFIVFRYSDFITTILFGPVKPSGNIPLDMLLYMLFIPGLSSLIFAIAGVGLHRIIHSNR